MLQKILNKAKAADKFLANNQGMIFGGLAVGGTGLLLYNLVRETERASYLSASVLGKRGSGLERILFDEAEEFDAQTKATLASGELYHQVVQKAFNISVGGRSEVKVIDDVLGVKGYIDILLPGNVPVEVKTISSKGLDNLNKPLDAHRSQLNFYLHGRKAGYGYLLYLDAQDISRTKVFKVGYEPSRLIVDVEEARSKILLNPGRASTKSIKWLSDKYSASPAYFNGIRQSSGYAASWDSMKESEAFPGGRLNSIVQASNYRSLKALKPQVPTMGLTIRMHETAIGHRARSSRKLTGVGHPNGSRMYR